MFTPDVLASLPNRTVSDLCAALVNAPHDARKEGKGALAGDLYRMWDAVRNERDRRYVPGAQVDPGALPFKFAYIVDTIPSLDVVVVADAWPLTPDTRTVRVGWGVRLV